MAATTCAINHEATGPATAAMVANERAKSLLLRAWIFAGLFYMALPGTLLGFSNLLAISAHRGLGALSPAWVQGHGHAQVFGWIGSFILGIGFYSQPCKSRAALRLPIACFVLWTLAVGLRWTANIYSWHWRILLPLSAAMELATVLFFLRRARQHKRPHAPASQPSKRPAMELWMITVLAGTAGQLAVVMFNFVECLRLALAGVAPGFPQALDQRYLVLLGWGFIVPFVWGFSARWLPAFLALPKPGAKAMGAALLLNLAGILCGVAGFARIATLLLAAGALVIASALRLFATFGGQAKVQGVHPSFPFFVRAAYLWLAVAGIMSVWAANADVHGGIWGAARHALTVGFAATMVFAIGPRILPHFVGFQAIFSKRLMLFSLAALQIGCTLRVSSEPLAYEGILGFAWKTLPLSGMFELTAVLLFAANLLLTIVAGRRAWAGAESIVRR